jgi:hypothetical protein
VYDSDQLKSLKEFITLGMFMENTIMHQHFAPNHYFFDALQGVECEFVTTLRHPYDAFVSLYFHVQNKRRDFQNKPMDAHYLLLDKPIDHPDVLRFIETSYLYHLMQGKAWIDSQRSHIVRFEDLKNDPFRVLKNLTDQIRPVDDKTINAAIEACSLQRMKSRDTTGHIRKGAIGDWRNHLTDAHMAIFRSDQFRSLIESLGYEAY